MGFDDKTLSKIRMLANGIVSATNAKNSWGVNAEVRRSERGAIIRLSLRSGSTPPSDPLMELGDLADTVRNELRLERDKLGQQIYGTSESTFETEGTPSFSFDVWRL
jgi:hypothetical protein